MAASVLSGLYLACSGVSVTWQHMHDGALSCSVGAQQSKNFTWRNNIQRDYGWLWVSSKTGTVQTLIQSKHWSTWQRDETHLCEHRKRCSLWPLSSSCSEKNLLFCPCAASSGYSQPPVVSKRRRNSEEIQNVLVFSEYVYDSWWAKAHYEYK